LIRKFKYLNVLVYYYVISLYNSCEDHIIIISVTIIIISPYGSLKQIILPSQKVTWVTASDADRRNPISDMILAIQLIFNFLDNCLSYLGDKCRSVAITVGIVVKWIKNIIVVTGILESIGLEMRSSTNLYNILLIMQSVDECCLNIGII